MRAFAVIIAGLTISNCCSGSVFYFFDFSDQLSVTIDGNPLANGGRVSNLSLGAESVNFDLTVNGTHNVVTETAFTRLFEPGDPNNVSDIFLGSFTNGSPTYHVTFGSVPDLPTIPVGAVDLTTVPPQGLPSSPYFEDGTLQKVATVFFSDGTSDTFFVQSAVPEPSSWVLLSIGGAAFVLLARNVSKK